MPVTLHYWNLDGQIDVTSLPLCPLCDQPMQKGEELKIVEAERCMGLAHANCCLEADEDEDP